MWIVLSHLASASVTLTIAHTATKTAGTPEITTTNNWAARWRHGPSVDLVDGQGHTLQSHFYLPHVKSRSGDTSRRFSHLKSHDSTWRNSDTGRKTKRSGWGRDVQYSDERKQLKVQGLWWLGNSWKPERVADIQSPEKPAKRPNWEKNRTSWSCNWKVGNTKVNTHTEE